MNARNMLGAPWRSLRLGGEFWILLMLLTAGCAKIGEPQPPEIQIPEAAADLTVKQLSDRVVLTVSKPSRNTNGSAVADLRSLEVYRLAGDPNAEAANPLPKESFASQAMPVFSIPAARFPEYSDGAGFTIEDKLLTPNRSTIYSRLFRYAVLFVNNKNQAAGFSNQAAIAPVPIPLPPANLSADVAELFIHLKWSAPTENMNGSSPPRIAGYKVYRSEEAQKFPSIPMNSDLITNPEFKDGVFQFDKTYYYRISVVGKLQDPYAESLPSEVLSVPTKDIFPPAPPGSFNAIHENGTAYLLWFPSSSPDVAGYRIHRLEEGESEKHLLKTGLITIPNFQDNDLKPGRKYEYFLTALDAHGNESAAVRATVQVP
jgi:hypothetical protein